MTIGVVIVTHNSEHEIAACLASVIREGFTTIRIIDSASSDRTTAILQRESCQYIALRDNKGFAYAANRAASHLDTDYILFLNPDTQLLPGTGNAIRASIKQYPQAGIMGVMLVDQRGIMERDAYGNDITLLSIIFRHMYPIQKPRTIIPVAWVSGGALIIKRSVFEQIEGFDDEFFLYWEDIDICKRVRGAGYNVYIDPNARILHSRGASSTDQQRKTELYDSSANRYFQKYYPPVVCICHLLLRRIYRLLRPLAR
ncbi:MAG TPA: glycosyltransferase family 2 protein [Candidatus Andersenbacteria bacterium]|nr:glycosyltransferase family 2 protein [Candidatus Andersenbacteria bacterium]